MKYMENAPDTSQRLQAEALLKACESTHPYKRYGQNPCMRCADIREFLSPGNLQRVKDGPDLLKSLSSYRRRVAAAA